MEHAAALAASLRRRGLREDERPPIVGGQAQCVPLPPMRPSRLQRNNDIRAVLTGRNVVHGPDMVVHAGARAGGGATADARGAAGVDATRVAVVAGRKVGGAVHRNRAKRRLRAALAGGSFPSGFDVVVVARRGVLSADFQSLQAELEALVNRAAARVPTAR